MLRRDGLEDSLVVPLAHKSVVLHVVVDLQHVLAIDAEDYLPNESLVPQEVVDKSRIQKMASDNLIDKVVNRGKLLLLQSLLLCIPSAPIVFVESSQEKEEEDIAFFGVGCVILSAEVLVVALDMLNEVVSELTLEKSQLARKLVVHLFSVH